MAWAPPAKAGDLAVVNVNNEVGIAFSELFKHYKENFGPSSSAYDREDGGAPGFAVSGSIMRDIGSVKNLYASLVFRFNSGSIAYTGSLQDGSPFNGTSDLQQKDLRLELGKGVLVTPSLLITPVFQYGYHVWNRALPAPSGGTGYSEDYTNSYIGGAVHLDYALTPRLVTRLRAGIATTVNPEIYISDDNITQSLGVRPVYQIGGGVDYALTPRLHLTTNVDFSHYSYGASEAEVTGVTEDGHYTTTHEPDSATNDLYVEFGVAYRF